MYIRLFIFSRSSYLALQHWPQCCFHSGRFRAIPGRLLSVPTRPTVSHKRVLFIYCECSGPSRTRIQDTVVYKHSRHSCFLSTSLDNNTFGIDDHYRSKVELDATSRNVPSLWHIIYIRKWFQGYGWTLWLIVSLWGAAEIEWELIRYSRTDASQFLTQRS